MKGLRRKVTAGLLAFLVCSGTVVHAETIQDAEEKAEQLEEQKEAAEAEKSSLISQLDSIISEMSDTQSRLDEKQAEIEAAEEELIQARVAEDEQYESMKIRIKFMYESGGTQFIEVLLASRNIRDFLNNAEYVSQLSEYDRKELVRYQEAVKSVEEKEAALEQDYEQLNQLQTELASKQTDVQALLDSKEAQLQDIQTQINENAETLAELKRQAEEAARIQEEQKKNNYTQGSNEIVVSGNGYFTHPCPGMTRKSSYFGEIRSFSSTPHTGNDYAAPTGTPTYAAASGKVIYAGYSSSAGNYVVINHGDGLTTKYMHHVSLTVRTGEYVEKGQQIGYVGNTGNSTGPHLHFQVEENGVPVNPDKYL